jgi:formylglycine-generating enzyme required for sulfatase activity
MISKKHLTRRGFLGITGVTAAAAALGACAVKKSVDIATIEMATTSIPPSTPEPTALMPTATSEPVSPIFPEMVLVNPGAFMMGSTDGLPKEAPVHEVTITRPFLVGIYPVTNAEYGAMCDVTKKCSYPMDDHPVSGVDWYGAVEYSNWLSEQTGLTPCYSGKGKFTKCDFLANGYRLPTEAEWEFAARGGNLSKGTIYSGGDDPDLVAWYEVNSGGKIHPVGEKLPNELGIYDMSGNRWEWCWDWFEERYYAESPKIDPAGPTTVPSGMMIEKSRRSGSSIEEAFTIRTTYRSADGIDYPGGNGFRLVRTADEI